MPNTIQVAAAIIRKNGKFLIAQRHDEGHLPNYWEFPGGKREEGETLEDCVRREIREELGIEISVGALRKQVKHAYPEKTIELFFYACSHVSGEPAPIDCQAVAWAAPAELAQYKFPPADHELIQELASEPSAL